MNAKLLIQDSNTEFDRWIYERSKHITSTDVACICGLNKWKSPLQLWAEKTGKVRPEFAPDKSRQMRIGNLLQPIVVEVAAELIGEPLRETKGFFESTQYPWAATSPDAFHAVPEPQFLAEVKTTLGRNARYWANGATPEIYLTQCQWHMGVLGLPLCHLVCMIGADSTDIEHRAVEFDAEIFDALVLEADAFRTMIERDIPPQPGPGDAALIQEVIARKEGEAALVGKQGLEARMLCDAIQSKRSIARELDAQAKPIREQIKLLENDLMMVLDGHNAARLESGHSIRISKVDVGPRMQQGYSYYKVTIKE